MGEERSIWPSGALEKSCFCLRKSSHQWGGQSALSHLVFLQWLNLQRGWGLTLQLWLSSIHKAHVGHAMGSTGRSAEQLSWVLVCWPESRSLSAQGGPGAPLLGDTPGNRVGWLGGPALVSWTEPGSWGLVFASRGSCWRVPSKVPHWFYWEIKAPWVWWKPSTNWVLWTLSVFEMFTTFLLQVLKAWLWLTPDWLHFIKQYSCDRKLESILTQRKVTLRGNRIFTFLPAGFNA